MTIAIRVGAVAKTTESLVGAHIARRGRGRAGRSAALALVATTAHARPAAVVARRGCVPTCTTAACLCIPSTERSSTELASIAAVALALEGVGAWCTTGAAAAAAIATRAFTTATITAEVRAARTTGTWPPCCARTSVCRIGIGCVGRAVAQSALQRLRGELRRRAEQAARGEAARRRGQRSVQRRRQRRRAWHAHRCDWRRARSGRRGVGGGGHSAGRTTRRGEGSRGRG
jgi:hypothetical protein